MENRIDACFEELRARGRCGFIAFIMAGDPSPRLTVPLVAEMERNGADIVELGVPFSDPLADGIVNQRAAERALSHGVSLGDVLGMASDIRGFSSIPIVLFTYLNPVFSYGFARFARDAARAGVDGVLSLDLPPEEEGAYRECLRDRGIRSIRLVSPMTPPGRMKLIAARAEGFIYYVSRTGVTGARTRIDRALERRVSILKRMTAIPVALGFGIGTSRQVKAAAGIADAVVVGSALVREIERGGDVVARVGEKVRLLTTPLRGRGRPRRRKGRDGGNNGRG